MHHYHALLTHNYYDIVAHHSTLHYITHYISFSQKILYDYNTSHKTLQYIFTHPHSHKRYMVTILLTKQYNINITYLHTLLLTKPTETL